MYVTSGLKTLHKAPRVVPLKGARAEEAGRLVLIAPATARAMAAYLRARRYHRLAESPSVWLGLRNSGPLDGTGLYRMLQRRADQADYEPAVHPHMFRHTSPTTGCPTAAPRAT